MMTDEQLVLWTNLNALAAISESTDDGMYSRRKFEVSGHNLMVFDYSLVEAYSRFLEPHGTECRGHTFIVSDKGAPQELLVWPLSKFFNVGESMCPVQLSDRAKVVLNKEDGSLISSYMIGGELFLKTNGSPNSFQCQDALSWLKTQPEQYFVVHHLTGCGYTVCMEWISPQNRHIVPYEDSSLPILAIRSTSDGSWVDLWDEDNAVTDLVRPFLVKRITELEGKTAQEILDVVTHWPASQEGVVIVNDAGKYAKIKSVQYVHVSGVVMNGGYRSTRTVYRAIIDGTIDDVIASVRTGCGELADLLERARVDVLDWKRQQIQTARRLYNEVTAHVTPDFKELNAWADQNIESSVVNSLFKMIMRQKELHREDFWMKQYKQCNSEIHISTFADAAMTGPELQEAGINWNVEN